jgi:hypothetical protein
MDKKKSVTIAIDTKTGVSERQMSDVTKVEINGEWTIVESNNGALKTKTTFSTAHVLSIEEQTPVA